MQVLFMTTFVYRRLPFPLYSISLDLLLRYRYLQCSTRVRTYLHPFALTLRILIFVCLRLAVFVFYTFLFYVQHDHTHLPSHSIASLQIYIHAVTLQPLHIPSCIYFTLPSFTAHCLPPSTWQVFNTIPLTTTFLPCTDNGYAAPLRFTIRRCCRFVVDVTVIYSRHAVCLRRSITFLLGSVTRCRSHGYTTLFAFGRHAPFTVTGSFLPTLGALPVVPPRRCSCVTV